MSSDRRTLGERLARARRARGLDADEVAERAGVGAGWYRWLEEGRDIGLSAPPLGWVAEALGLDEGGRHELFALAAVDGGERLASFAEPLPPALVRLLDTLAPLPAYVIGRRGDVLAWNQPTEAVYRCHLIPPLRRNTYLFLFMQPEVRKLLLNWDEQAHRLVRHLRQARTRAQRRAQ